jgi:hypothetical protein
MEKTSQIFITTMPDGLNRFDASPSRQSPVWGIVDPYIWVKATDLNSSLDPLVQLEKREQYSLN